MSEADRITATDDAVNDMEETRQKRKYGARNTAIGSFHDSRTTVDKVIHEVSKVFLISSLTHDVTQLEALYNRTDTHSLLFTWRSGFNDYARPRTFATSTAVEEFVQLTCKMDIELFSKKGECYILSGVDGEWTSCPV